MSIAGLDVKGVKLRSRERQLADLSEEYEILTAELGKTLEPHAKPRIRRRMLEIEHEMDRLEEERRALRTSGSDKRQRTLEWESYLWEIDFDRAFGIFHPIRKRLGRQGGAALFLLQNGNAMGAKWFVQRMRDELIPSQEGCPPIPVGFPYGPPTADWLLDNLARRLGVEAAADAVIGELLSSLWVGSVALIEMTIKDNLATAEDFLPWFLADFWAPMVRKLSTAARFANVVTVIIVSQKIAPGRLKPEMCCKRGRFDPEKIVDLPLQKWDKDDIRAWLLKYAIVPKTAKDVEIERVVQGIFLNGNEGIPSDVRKEIEDYINGQEKNAG